MFRALLLGSLAWVSLTGCQAAGPALTPGNQEAAIGAVLDELHLQASKANFEGYFALFHEDAVFLGTDRAEYWPLPDFKRYTKARFASGSGWTYVPSERFVHQRGEVAWFEERVVHDRYGETRGTGVLIYEDQRWQIAQYNLVLPIPNDLFDRYSKEIFNYYRR